MVRKAAPVRKISCPNLRHGSANYKIVSKGFRSSAAGMHHRYQCQSKSGAKHAFSVIETGATKPVIKVKPIQVLCPDSKHQGSKVQSRGTMKSKTGTWAQYRCQRVTGELHYFRILVSADGSSHISLTQPPDCPEHLGSKVVRNGTYGSRKARRQRYRCEPNGAEPTHHFSPPLSREAVGLMASCSTCDEMLSPHRGTLTAARHTPWTLTGVVQALNNLSLGSSYSAVALDLRAQRKKTMEHLREAHGIELSSPEGALPPALDSWHRQQGRNAWQLGSDLVEQYSPLLFTKVEQVLIAREEKVRAENDAVLENNTNASLAHPLVYILDELPVQFKRWSSERTRYQQASWSLLVVVELIWHTSKDPMVLPQREPRLRLARAYPRRDEAAWRLVLNELPVRPDFVISDSADAIIKAVSNHYGPGVVGYIPSLYHVQKNIRTALMNMPNSTVTVSGRTTLVPTLDRAMKGLTRAELMKSSNDVATWWDNLEKAVTALPAGAEKVKTLRETYEAKMIKTVPLLRKNPQVPASNAAVESRIRLHLEPFLENRKHRYRNLARTNFLMDLAVCRAQGLFSDLNKVAEIIRESNESSRGWAPTPRLLADTQPALSATAKTRAHVYASLLNAQVIPALTAARGIVALPNKQPRKKPDHVPTGNPRGRPPLSEQVKKERKEIREKEKEQKENRVKRKPRSTP